MGKPKPFARPVSAGGAHGRSWKHMPASELQLGDLVLDFGLLVSSSVKDGCLVFRNPVSESRVFVSDEQVYAFARDPAHRT